MPFTIKTSSFEGPLDLLLELIEQRKLLVNDISLSKVTDDFIEHVRNFVEMPMGESAHFILVASTLLLIKSKSLLPDLNLTEEEQGDIHDLEIRLKIYKRIKEASRQVQALWDGDMIFSQQESRAVHPVFAPDPAFTLEKALNTLKDLVNRLPKKETLSKVTVRKVVSLEEMIGNLTERIGSQLKMSFRQFTSEHKGERISVIVSFLAMLELVKQGVLQVSQERDFSDIEMQTKEVGVPRY
ncbi:MAG: ScpA family protein [Candidatus Paceibacterota bacterium]